MIEELKPLAAKFQERGTNFGEIAKAARINPMQFSQMLNRRRKGKHSWRRVRPLLRDDEVEIIKKQFGEVFGED